MILLHYPSNISSSGNCKNR